MRYAVGRATALHSFSIYLLVISFKSHMNYNNIPVSRGDSDQFVSFKNSVRGEIPCGSFILSVLIVCDMAIMPKISYLILFIFCPVGCCPEAPDALVKRRFC